MPEGPFGGPRPFAKEERVPVRNKEKTERLIQRYLEFLSDEYSITPPTVKIWDDDVWIQIVIDPDTVEANYDNFRNRINLNERDIQYVYVIHEFAHHVAHVSDDVDMILETLIREGETDPDVLEGMNELQVEKLAKEIGQTRKAKLNWNELIAKGTALKQV